MALNKAEVNGMMRNDLVALLDVLASLSGMTHDIGKATVLVQRKLRDARFPASDPVRHEWISMQLLDALISGKTLAQAFDLLEVSRLNHSPFARNEGLRSANDVLKFCVVTHHGMLSPSDARQDAERGSDRTANHVRTISEHPCTKSPADFLKLHAPFDATLEHELTREFETLRQLTQALGQVFNSNTWRVVALYIRACLIMADHTVSARRLEHYNCALAANTIRDRASNTRKLNQDLNYHLREVERLTRTYVHNVATVRWNGVSEQTHNRLLEINEATDIRFSWQDQASVKLGAARKQTQAPALVLNVAGTGTGKTRMNLRAAAALSRRPTLRATTVLNLRTLTLQTGHAYETEAGIGKGELVCVIGDKSIRALHEQTIANTDENPEELEFEASDNRVAGPDFLKEYLQLHPTQAGLITAPILVSTVDFVIAAGEPHKQGHHAAALLRVMHSDLIIDEADDYEPHAFVAILRLVEMALLFGNNVVISTATLPRPMVEALVKVYQSAFERHQKLNATSFLPLVAIIDNYDAPALFAGNGPEDIGRDYVERVQKASARMAVQRVRVPKLAMIPVQSESGFLEAIKRSVEELHDQHCWRHEVSGKLISIGLVRVANISTAILVARYLSAAFPGDYIATYHAREFFIQRYRKELILDELLTRKHGNTAINRSPYIAGLLNRRVGDSVKLIVVATPIEEVGRDHDFDWGVFEPSSGRSLVQGPGRVNRHRLCPVDHPNIHILQYNYRHCIGLSPAFYKPGFETAKGWEHDLGRLLNWNELQEISASLRLGNHLLGRLEDEVLAEVLRTPTDILVGHRRPQDWMTEFFYTRYPLRSRTRTDHWTFVDGQFHQWILGPLGFEKQNFDKSVTRVESAENAWLSWTIDDLVAFADERKMENEKAFEIKIANYRGKPLTISWDQSFGFLTR